MFSFGRPEVRQFGGIGAMVARPGIRLAVRSAARLEASGPLAERAVAFARRTAATLGFAAEPNCRIDIESAPREHVGLGTGTQLGLAVAAAIYALAGRPISEPAELARAVGRGERSAIGTHGFALGGLLLEAGKRRASDFSPLVARVEMPAEWRVLLLIPRSESGMAGDAERQAFAELPPVPPELTGALTQEALLNLLPAAAEAEFAAFSGSLFRFGQLAGSCFAARQQGALRDARATELVRRLRELGVEGVAQSSWGPTLLAVLPDEQSGRDLIARLQAETDLGDYECLLTQFENTGARIEIEPEA